MSAYVPITELTLDVTAWHQIEQPFGHFLLDDIDKLSVFYDEYVRAKNQVAHQQAAVDRGQGCHCKLGSSERAELDNGISVAFVTKFVLRTEFRRTEGTRFTFDDFEAHEECIARVVAAYRAYRKVGNLTTRLQERGERGEDYKRAQRRERQNKLKLVYELDRFNRHWFFLVACRHSPRWRAVRAWVRARAIAVYWHGLAAHLYAPEALNMASELANALHL